MARRKLPMTGLAIVAALLAGAVFYSDKIKEQVSKLTSKGGTV